MAWGGKGFPFESDSDEIRLGDARIGLLDYRWFRDGRGLSWMEVALVVCRGVANLLKNLMRFFPAKRRVRGETIAKGEGQLQLSEKSVDYWGQRLGWSPGASRFLATAFAFQPIENIASVLEGAQRIHDTENFEEDFVKRAEENPSIIGPTLEAAKFITSEELRELLSRILSSDVQRPGSVSRRTVSIAEDLSSEDFWAFMKLREITWRILNSQLEYLVVLCKNPRCFQENSSQNHLFDLLDAGLKRYHEILGTELYHLSELQQLGLVLEGRMGTGIRLADNGVYLSLDYRGRIARLYSTSDGQTLRTGSFYLTRPGIEILSLYFDDAYDSLQGYFEDVCQGWREDGLVVEELGN